MPIGDEIAGLARPNPWREGSKSLWSYGRYRAMQSQINERAVVHVVDDDVSIREALEGLFGSVGLAAQTYSAARDFLASPVVDAPGCIVADVRLPDMNGLDLQAHLTQMYVRLPVVMITGHGDITMSVRAMKGSLSISLRSRSVIRTCLML
jgi:ActR/RegA family two-component response regulator